MIDQRRPTPVRRRARRPGVLWNPSPKDVVPRPDDVYLVVDEQDDETVVVLGSRWPELDAFGRLYFENRDPVAACVPEKTLEQAIRRSRGRGARRRPLRIGDVFLVRGLPAASDIRLTLALTQTAPSDWGQFVDLTGPARDAAKAALFAAAAPRVSDEHATALGLTTKAKADAKPRTGTTAASSI